MGTKGNAPFPKGNGAQSADKGSFFGASQNSVTRRGRNKMKSVISGDMRLGNDTARDGQGDFSQESSPGRHAIPLSEKANGLFRQALPRSQRGTGRQAINRPGTKRAGRPAGGETGSERPDESPVRRQRDSTAGPWENSSAGCPPRWRAAGTGAHRPEGR